jgi:membrane protease YdiL (CAAX protease family)
VAHVSNILSGASLKGAFIQACGAAILGALLAAIYLRSGNIFVVVILHAFNDFSVLIGSGFFGIGSPTNVVNSYSYLNLIGLCIYLIPILVLLRKNKTEEIIKI